MLFLVPEQDGPPSAPPSSDFNVELDLDDAPFLDEPEPEPEAPPPPEENPDPVAMMTDEHIYFSREAAAGGRGFSGGGCGCN